MPSADKRARQKENARAAREQREAAVKRSKRNRSMVTAGIFVAIFVIVIVALSLVGGKKNHSASKTTTTTTLPAPDQKIDPTKTYTATIATSLGTIGVKLDTKTAPIAAGHFITLANRGIYNGSAFTRVVKDFVIQGGAPGGDPTKDYGRTVPGEVPKGKYALGDLAAAKTGADPNGTFDSQFFIVTGSQGVALPPQYADFGSVTSGMDVVKKIEALPTDSNEAPTTAVPITKVTIAEVPATASTTTTKK